MTEETTTAVTNGNKAMPVKLGVTKAAIGKLKKKYSKVPDASTKEGYAAIMDAKRELVPLRTAVEKEAKVQKEAAQDHINRINAAKNEIVEAIKEIEKPLYDERQRVDDLREKEKREAAEKEERRVATIELAINHIEDLTEGLLGADLATLEARLEEANSITITDEEYMEFVEQASSILGSAKTQLTNAVEMARASAEQQKVMDEQKRKADLQESLNRIRMAPVDLIGKSVADIKAAIDKLESIDTSLYGDNAAVADEAIAETTPKLVAMLDQQQTIEDQKEREAQQQRDQAAAEEEKRQQDIQRQRAEAMEARRPEDEKLRKYVDDLVAIQAPEVESEHGVAVLRAVSLELTNILDYVYQNTQAAES